MSIEQHSSFKCDSGLPQCCGELVSLCTDGGDLHKCGEGKENDNPQRNPSHYATGYFTPYDEQQWEKWMEAYTLQTGVTYTVRTGKHQSTKADRMNGIINTNGTVHQFKSEWTQQYHCHRAGKPRLKTEAKDALKRRNAPGSKLIGCSACIFTRLICVEGKHTILQVTMPKLAAHLSIHDPRSIEDQLTLKPLQEIKEKVGELVEFQLMKQINLKISLFHWVKHELIPKHIKEGKISKEPSSYNRAYYPTNEDLRYLAQQAILEQRDHMQDQNAIAALLQQQAFDSKFSHFLQI